MEIDETKYGYVYRITNLINGKTYIGQHKIVKNENWLSYMGSGRLIRYSIYKHGLDNFSKELVCYADSKKELNTLEKILIEKELLKGKSEYNINGSASGLSITMDELKFTDEDLLEWYFDENLSYQEIADRIGCSKPVIFEYMKKFKELDHRFSSIKRGSNRGKTLISEETRQKVAAIVHRLVECEICSREITYINYSKHLKACNSDNYCDGLQKHKCATDECDALILTKNKFCREHYRKYHQYNNGKNFGNSVKLGGLIASHNRWHVKRNKPNPDCALCQKESI